MSSTFETFERYKQRGLDARKAGQFASAKVYFLEAARTILELSKQASTTELTQARQQMAQRLLELAKECELPNPKKSVSVDQSSELTAESSEASANQWIVKEKPSVRFDQVAGLDEVKDEIRLKMVYPFTHADLAKKFDIRGGGGILLYGPPGTGKTLLARATAGELDATFFNISPAEMLSKWVGEAEQNIKKLFDAAKAERRAVIFIDEIEALVPARRDEGSSIMQRVVPQILQGMEGFDKSRESSVLFLGATNVPWQLDPAVLRPGRFDERIYIPLPDIQARRRLLEIYFNNRPVAADVSLDTLAEKLDGYSGADIKYICDRSALLPFIQAVSGAQEAEITAEIIHSVISETPKSVTDEMCKKFIEWTDDRVS